MVNEKMTVHKALCELKTLDARIEKAIAGTTFVFENKHSNTKVGGVPIEDVIREIKESYQKINDLIRRRDAIKRAVVLSNALTKVTVGGETYSVAEAIEVKNHSIPIRQGLMSRMSKQNRDARTRAEKANGRDLETRADEYIVSLFGNVEKKNVSDEVAKARETFIKQQTVDVVDPLGIVGEIQALDDQINAFIVEIDSALSVSNALTEIEISY